MNRRQRRYVNERETIKDIKNLLYSDNHKKVNKVKISENDKALSLVGDIIESAREISSLVTFDGANPDNTQISRLIGVLNEMLKVEKKMRNEVGQDEIIPLK